MRAVMDGPDPSDEAPENGKVLEFTGGPRDGSKERPFRLRDSDALDNALTALNMNARFNLRSQRVELAQHTLRANTEWRAVNRRALASLRERMAQRIYVYTEVKGKAEAKPLTWGRDLFTDTLDALVYHREVDPLMDWLRALPEWDGVARLNLMLHCLDVPDDELTKWASRYLVLGVIQRTFEPGCKLDEIPVLIGPQGIGKSAVLRAILPPEMPDLFGDSLEWDAPEKTKVESTLGKALVEASEMAGRRRAEIEKIKNYLTRQDDGGIRLAYATGTEPLPRRFIIVASTNNESDLPNDPSGNRRFVPIPAAGNLVGSVETFFAHHRKMLWAEGLALYADGHRANLPRELHPAQRERAELHRDRDDVLEDAVDALYGNGPLKLSQIIELIGDPARNATPHRVARALKNAEWTMNRTKKGGRLWTRERVTLSSR